MLKSVLIFGVLTCSAAAHAIEPRVCRVIGVTDGDTSPRAAATRKSMAREFFSFRVGNRRFHPTSV